MKQREQAGNLLHFSCFSTAPLCLYGQSTPAETGTVPTQAKAILYYSYKS